MLGRICSCLLMLASFALPHPAGGQSNRSLSVSVRESAVSPEYTLTPRRPQAPIIFGFPQLARAAGLIFSGHVTAISHAPSSGQSSELSPEHVEAVAITFHVEQAIRGVIPGEDLTISQWTGLWASGQRYQVGEHVLLFLYPQSKLGLTSRVGGPLGRFRVDPLGRVLLSPQHISVFGASPVVHGRSQIPFNEFAKAVRQASGEE